MQVITGGGCGRGLVIVGYQRPDPLQGCPPRHASDSFFVKPPRETSSRCTDFVRRIPSYSRIEGLVEAILNLMFGQGGGGVRVVHKGENKPCTRAPPPVPDSVYLKAST